MNAEWWLSAVVAAVLVAVVLNVVALLIEALDRWSK